MKVLSLHLIPKTSKKAKKYEVLSKWEYLAQQTPLPKEKLEEIKKQKAIDRQVKKEDKKQLKEKRALEHKQRMKELKTKREERRTAFEEKQIKKAMEKEYRKLSNIGKPKLQIMQERLQELQDMPKEEKTPKYIRKERRLSNFIDKIQGRIKENEDVQSYINEMCKKQEEIEHPKVIKRGINFSNHALFRYHERIAPLGISITQIMDDITKNWKSIKLNNNEFVITGNITKYIISKDRISFDWIVITMYEPKNHNDL